MTPRSRESGRLCRAVRLARRPFSRGPHLWQMAGLVPNAVAAGHALCVPGNHDMKLMRKLRGRNVHVAHGLAQSLAEIDALPETQREEFAREAAEWFDGLVSHYVLDDGRIVVAHAGMKESMQGRGSGTVRGKRIIYGPDYTAERNLIRLRSRRLGAKRSLALREFALGVEALERFVRREPLRRVHECVFGVLALESEPVDPRL